MLNNSNFNVLNTNWRVRFVVKRSLCYHHYHCVRCRRDAGEFQLYYWYCRITMVSGRTTTVWRYLVNTIETRVVTSSLHLYPDWIVTCSHHHQVFEPVTKRTIPSIIQTKNKKKQILLFGCLDDEQQTWSERTDPQIVQHSDLLSTTNI